MNRPGGATPQPERTAEQLRVLIVTPTATIAGGVERILESLATGLPAHGIQPVFGLANGRTFHSASRFAAAFPMMKTIEMDSRSGTAFSRRLAIRRAISAVEPDIVLTARLFDALPVASAMKAAGHPLRLALTIQAYEPEYFTDARQYAAHIDLCVTSGNLIAAAATGYAGLPAERVTSIPGGVRPAGRYVEHRADRPLRIGYVGRIEQVQKRILDFIRLADELRRRQVPAEFAIAGSGSAEAELRRELPEATFFGWLDTKTLYEKVYPELDVFVHFAEWEGVTIAPREAMAHGVVPVISRFPGAALEGDFRDGVNSLTFEVGDVAAAADLVETLHRDRDLLSRLSLSARESQQGIRSEAGAVAAWAEAFRRTMQLPSRTGALPPAPVDSGFLTRLGIPERISEPIRALRRRPAASAGAEWPHCSGNEIADAATHLAAIAAREA